MDVSRYLALPTALNFKTVLVFLSISDELRDHAISTANIGDSCLGGHVTRLLFLRLDILLPARHLAPGPLCMKRPRLTARGIFLPRTVVEGISVIKLFSYEANAQIGLHHRF